MKTVYETLVERVVASKKFANLAKQFVARGHTKQDMDLWAQYAAFIGDVCSCADGSLNQKKEFIRKYVDWCLNGGDFDKVRAAAAVIGYPCESEKRFTLPIPEYRLLPEEIKIIKNAEELGRGQNTALFYRDGYGHKTAYCVPYKSVAAHEGGRKDVLVVFSGHQETGTKAVECFYNYVRHNHCLPDGIMFLGLEDNQNLTEFNPSFVLRKSSEYRMYLRQAIALGVPKGLLKKLLMAPTDTDTAQNIQLTINTLNKYGMDHVNLIFLSYPVYQMRVMSEFAFGLTQSADAPDCYVRIADIAPKTEDGSFEESRYLSYDQPDKQLLDLSLANCVAHLYREHGKSRFALPGYDCYPEEFKALAPLGLGYSYPNVVHELCGTDETVAAVLKIMRTLMLDARDKGLSGEAQDKQQQVLTKLMAEKLCREGFTTPELMKKTRLMNEKQFLAAILK